MELSEHISKKKFAVYAALALIGCFGIYLVIDYYRAKSMPPLAKIMNDAGHPFYEAPKTMPGIPIPKAHTSKGAMCLCANGTKCNGTFTDCSCCNIIEGHGFVNDMGSRMFTTPYRRDAGRHITGRSHWG